MQRLVLLGLNHATAPLPMREKLAFTPEQRRAALIALRERYPEAEAVLISTCNRVELYAARPVHGSPNPQEIVQFLCSFHGLPAADFQPHLYHKAERDVVEHLFSVTSSLDSMVVGETQILGQVRDAYEAAREAGSAGATLNPLFQRATAVAKQVMSETAIAEGHISIASVAVDCAKRIFDQFGNKIVLSIGAGKMSTLVLRGFADLHPKRLMICNRDQSKAAILAEKFSGEACAFESLDDHLVAADIVVSGTGSTRPIITRQRFESLLKQRRYRPIFLIDIALPRDIEASVGKLENVYLYNIDDLQQVVSNTRTHRGESVEQAKKIVAEQVERYLEWNRTREMGPMIDQLYKKHHELAREELDRTLAKLPGLSVNDRAQLEDLARRIVNKMLHDPIKSLRESGTTHAGGMPYLHAIQKLFQLNVEDADEEQHDQASE